ncbi:MAG TPA: bifunctional diaminohydroxyphosphoribosylaminopyrimidine deaminase/5-amino-6-(5-phosphoribosylamino)uracil reductase RibD [Steroidobacteraceae bacterium]|jgi:diaminohydroxyphosphoribosylaminopyrimidine deaminase/5-amino-6-(5-phosphoribosylamino)uracil reductase|nr:bifunctional diaminohydroxyphosphoribosylaminopyrimidine deaminase/5-amino-6-(5-phosphoribosylamino)uracil reductase RibD [Steroidobacteraceae bacterium]
MSSSAESSAEPQLAGRAERDLQYMRRALLLAERGLNSTDPNPRVGCVLVQRRDGGERIVGEGWTAPIGGPHAEVRALRAAGTQAVGATAYISLEPCAHYGRTPPCAQALIDAGIARVVYAADDPNPLVNGAGAAALRAAGIPVIGGLLAGESRGLNPGFFRRMQTGLPWVRLKLAASLDARTALASGESRWITGEAARADVQRWRARSSVVLTGSGTALADDPALNVRLPGAERQPLRVLLDSALRVPPEARLFAPPGQVLIFTASADASRRALLQQRGVRVESAALAANGAGLALEPILRQLANRSANEVWIEAGARLAGAFVSADLVDELIVYLAPRLLGEQARPLLQLPAPARLADAQRLRFVECTQIGEDLRLIARPLVRGELRQAGE